MLFISRAAPVANEDCDTDHEDDEGVDTFSVPSASRAHTSAYTNCVSGDCRDDDISDSSSNSDFEYTYTPKRRCVSVSDSGCATGPSSSASSCSTKNSRNHKVCSSSNRISDDEYMKMVEKFRKRVRKVRMNIRRKISADSDSN